MKWLLESDLIVPITNPSLGVGYELVGAII